MERFRARSTVGKSFKVRVQLSATGRKTLYTGVGAGVAIASAVAMVSGTAVGVGEANRLSSVSPSAAGMAVAPGVYSTCRPDQLKVIVSSVISLLSSLLRGVERLTAVMLSIRREDTSVSKPRLVISPCRASDSSFRKAFGSFSPFLYRRARLTGLSGFSTS